MTPDPFGNLDAVLSLPLAVGFGEPVDAVQTLAALEFLRGREPYSCTVRAEGTLAPEDLDVLDGASVLRLEEHVGRLPRWSACLRGDGWTAQVESGPSNVRFTVYSVARKVGSDASAKLVRLVSPDDDAGDDGEVPVAFHYLGERGVSTERRLIEAPGWSDISTNYPVGASAALGALMGMEGAPGSGRLVLLHGPPGTGKTTAIRALAKAWQPWCDTSYVMDPEVLFSRTSYLHQLVLDGDGSFAHMLEDEDEDEDAAERRWRLLVIEDADEIISADAKDRAGQALSRLLNLTDGLLGQGLRNLVMITTNEPMSALHAALTRPGRCLAEVEIPAFDAAGARQWLGEGFDGAVPAQGATLAELFSLRDGNGPLRPAVEARHRGGGNYV